MSGTYKLIELCGTSEDSFTQAVRNAIAEAGKSLSGLSWFEVTESRGRIQEGGIAEFQVKVKVAFKVMRSDVGAGDAPRAAKKKK